VQFDRTVTDRSKSFFAFFGGRIRPNFSPVFPFLLFGRQRVAKLPAITVYAAPALANCQLPIASCLFSKIIHH